MSRTWSSATWRSPKITKRMMESMVTKQVVGPAAEECTSTRARDLIDSEKLSNLSEKGNLMGRRKDFLIR